MDTLPDGAPHSMINDIVLAHRQHVLCEERVPYAWRLGTVRLISRVEATRIPLHYALPPDENMPEAKP